MRAARTSADYRKDQRKINVEENELRQHLVKRDTESNRRPKKRTDANADGDSGTRPTKKQKTRESTFQASEWLPEDGIATRSIVEAEWNPDKVHDLSTEGEEGQQVREDDDPSSGDAHAGRHGPAHESDSDDEFVEPKFQCEANSRVLTKILTQVMEKGPQARAKARDDRILINESKAHFRSKNRPVKVKGESRFKFQRMLSTLPPHQVAGAAWIRYKELSGEGAGLLADDMGLGKTVQMLAAIMDGKPDKAVMKDGQGSTLVVCSASLVDQWEAEAKKHCHPKWLGKVTRFRAADFEKSTNDPLGFLQTHDIM